MKIGDVWGNDDFIYDILRACGNKFVCKRTRKSDYKQDIKEYTASFNYGKLLKSGEYKRPKANETCSWADCQFFNIGTREEFDKVAKGGLVTLDKYGELPTQNYIDLKLEYRIGSFAPVLMFSYNNTWVPTHMAAGINSFMGFVFNEKGKEVLSKDEVLWRDPDGLLYQRWHKARKLEHAKAVRCNS